MRETQQKRFACLCAVLVACLPLAGCAIGHTREGGLVAGFSIGGKGAVFDEETIDDLVTNAAAGIGGAVGGAAGGPLGAIAGEWVATSVVGGAMGLLGFTGATARSEKKSKEREDRAWDEAKAEAKAERDVLLAEVKKAAGGAA